MNPHYHNHMMAGRGRGGYNGPPTQQISGMLQNMNIHQTSTSGLNVQANVFVPGPGFGGAGRTQYQHPQQAQYNQFTNAQNGYYPGMGHGQPLQHAAPAVPMYPNGVPQPVQQAQAQRAHPHQNYNPEDPFVKMMSEVEIGLERLVEEPHNFDAWGPAISDRLKLTKMDQQQLRHVADIVFEFALYNPQASYSVARLCALLNSEKIRCAGGANDASTFRDVLLSRCRQEYEGRAASMATCADRMRAFGLFLSELFIQMENTSGLRLIVLESAIHDICNDLILTAPVLEANVRCAVSMMKCSGRSLSEGLEEQRRRIQTHAQLLDKYVQNNPGCSEPLKRQISVLCEQVSNNWKATKSTNAVSGAALQPPVVPATVKTANDSDETCIFGPDGQPLTEEEVAFLESQTAPFLREESLNASVDLSNDGDIERELAQFLEEHTDS